MGNRHGTPSHYPDPDDAESDTFDAKDFSGPRVYIEESYPPKTTRVRKGSLVVYNEQRKKHSSCSFRLVPPSPDSDHCCLVFLGHDPNAAYRDERVYWRAVQNGKCQIKIIEVPDIGGGLSDDEDDCRSDLYSVVVTANGPKGQLEPEEPFY